ncbi:uncharacterized protein LOC131149674 [Malania oleifera]|uniref:uncharacterized protein LOC131149674 n=1 Tax=Malania oleifera TaxID=397392 RepID=UPI0025ADA195|nr:uncharacterized protein LOC131149674 [Malania oleifera]
MSLISTSTTPHDLWSKLQRLYTNLSRTRVMQLKEELNHIQQESHSVSEYLYAIKVLVDKLSVTDSLVSVNDITLYVLNDLGPKFHEIAVLIRARETSLTFKELYDMLVGHKSYLRRVDNSNSALVVTANTTQCHTTNSTFNHNQSSSTSSYGPHRPNSGHYNCREQSDKPQISC